jgi:hypothetical protein
MKKIDIGALDLRNPEDPEEFLDASFEMTDDYVMTTEVDLITLPDADGERIRVLTNGNIMLLVSPQGTGKTAVAEAIAAAALNGQADAFGFKVNLSSSERVLLIDTERTKNDMSRGWKRIVKRGSLWKMKEKYFTGNKITRLKMVSYKFLEDIKDCIPHLKVHAKEGFRLIIIDVVTDFLGSINDELAARAFVKDLMKIAEESDCGIVCTIHPNPKDKDYKARGHIGSELQNKAESVFACFRADDNTRVITTDFSQGKNRNGGDKLNTAFMWDKDKGMHVSVFLSEEIKKKVNKEYLEFDVIIETLYNTKNSYSESELLNAFKQELNREELDFEYIENYIKERNSLEKNGFDSLWYKKEVGQTEVPF